MRQIGLIGGTSWHSTAIYYKLLNEGVNARLGGLASAELAMISLNFEQVFQNFREDNEKLLIDSARRLRDARAEGILMCANTMHQFTGPVEKEVRLPVIHIADASARACVALGAKKVALLGTRWTMEMDFFRDRLGAHGLEWLIPEDTDRELIHQSVFKEMGIGIFSDATRAEYVRIISNLQARGAEAVILACTEIPLLIRPPDVELPTVDTTAVHAEAALEFMFGEASHGAPKEAQDVAAPHAR